MDQKTTINVLIVADALADGEQLINILRKAGLSIHAEAVRNEDYLRERLDLTTWDLLFIFVGNKRVSLAQLHAVLVEMGQDLPALALGITQECSVPATVLNIAVDNLQNQQQCARLVHFARNELNNLDVRRSLRKTSAALKELQQRYQLLLDSASDAVCYLHEGLHIYANQAYATLFGYHTATELRSVPFLDLVDEQDMETVREFLRDPQSSGKSCLFHGVTGADTRTRLNMECAVVPYEEERSQQIIVRPATGNLELQSRIKAQQGKDLLTNLLNRNSLLERIEQAIANAIYEHQHSALLLIALTGFDDYSALAGRPAANILLADAARLLDKAAPEGVVVGRCGDSEFALLLPTSRSARNEKLLAAIQSTLSDDLQKLMPPGNAISVSAGLAAINELSPAAEIVISRARHNLTMRDMRNNGDLPADPYGTPEQMFQRLEEAFENEDFVLVFQPVVSLKEDGIQRYEVRIRLQDKGYMIYPPRFLELANQHGLGERIDRWVAERSLQVLQDRDNPNLQLIVNLTHNSIVSPDFLPWLQQRMHDRRQAADNIVLQISELDIVSSPDEVNHFCQQLQQLRIDLSVTHFGCTLTPFKYLPHESAAYVKLDKSLLEDIGLNLIQRDKLNTTVNALHAKGLLVIAPMIDQINLLPLLWQANVNFVQGNFLQAPTDKLDFSFVQDEELTLDSFR